MARKLEGTERGLDALVGVVILVAEIVIAVVAIAALYEFGSNPPAGASGEAIDIGFTIAVFGSIIFVGITTLIYLVRIAIGRRSFTAPLWGTILMTVAVVVGYFIMASGT